MRRSAVRIDPARAAAIIELPASFHPLLVEKLAHEKMRLEWKNQKALPDNAWGPFQTAIGRRELRIQDAILKEADLRGHVIRHNQGSLSDIWLVVDGERVDWEFRERYQYRPVLTAEPKQKFASPEQRQKHIAEPTGCLVLSIKANYSAKQDVHEKRGRLFERRIAEILQRLEDKASHAIAQRDRGAREERESQARDARKRRTQILEDREYDRWSELREMAAGWKEVERLREFVGAVTRQMGDLPDVPLRANLWLEWARSRIDALDPFRDGPSAFYDAVIRNPRRRKMSGYEMEFGEEYPDEE
jgi:hypothetical protein